VELLNLENYKADIHRTLISKLDLEKLSRVNTNQARQAVLGIVKEIMADQRVPLITTSRRESSPIYLTRSSV